MRELLNDRRRAVIAIAVTVAAVFAVMHLTGGSSDGGTAPAKPKRDTGSLLRGAPGGDAAAETVLRSAAIAMEGYVTEHGDFAGAAGAMASVEPNIGWVAGGAQAAANQAAVTVGADNLSYTLTTTSVTGAVYVYARDTSANVVRTCGPGCTW